MNRVINRLNYIVQNGLDFISTNGYSCRNEADNLPVYESSISNVNMQLKSHDYPLRVFENEPVLHSVFENYLAWCW